MMATHAQAQSSQRHNIDPHEASACRVFTHTSSLVPQSCFRPRRFCTGERKGRCDFEIGRRQRLVTQPRTTDAQSACDQLHVDMKDAILSPERDCEAGSRGSAVCRSGERDLLRLTDTDPSRTPSNTPPLTDFQRGGMQPPVEEKSSLLGAARPFFRTAQTNRSSLPRPPSSKTGVLET